MFSLEELSAPKLHRIRIACAYLFSPESAMDDDFIRQLDIEKIKKAYREKVKRYHPDLHQDESERMINRRVERFINLKESYAILTANLKDITGDGEKHKKILAVGGAKGGIGKSIFAANLGVLLSSLGKRTVIADLDLGGADLHLYLGETYLERKINDFLTKRVKKLNEIIIQNKYGPQFIGGDSSQLGAANIGFMVKLKLLRAIKNLDADYIILDLGGDTSYNILDFFLAADYGLILTTCDPASYLDAYRFIKVALYRKLNRLFGPESVFRSSKNKDTDLAKLIYEATTSTDGTAVKNIKELLERIEKQLPLNVPFMNEVIASYTPYLVLNKVTDNSNVSDIVNHIQKVSKQMLSIDIEHIGSVSFQPEIEESARSLIPLVAKNPTGKMAKEIGHILKKLLYRH